MDDVNTSYRARKTIIEMLIDRKYDVPDEYKEVDFETFRYLYNNKKYDIYCTKNNDTDKKVYVKFIHVNKIKPNSIREFITAINAEYLGGSDDELLIILKNKPNNSILKISKEKNFKMCEINWLARLQFNITKHDIVPQHILVTEEELMRIMEKYQLTSTYQLPLINKDDPIVKYYNFKPGSVCKIIRPSKTSADHIYFRCVK